MPFDIMPESIKTVSEFVKSMSGIIPIEGHGLILERGGRRLIDRIDLTVGGDGLTVIMGPNGAGKSVLLRLLAGLMRPDGGSVRWAGRVPDRTRTPRLGFVFQQPVLLRRSALANVRFVLKGGSRRSRSDRAMAALSRAGLVHLADSPARLLSGGEQQRLALARALAPEPEVLLLDEPCANLDPAATAAIEALVADAARRGTKVLLVTHDIGQARRLADEVVFLHGGRIAERGPAGTFFDQPESDAARAYLAGRLVV